MYRSLIAVLLFLSISYQSFLKLGIVIWYQVNKDYIANNLCENRAKPEKKCCGKCYLNKQLKKADQRSSTNSTVPAKWNMGEIAVYTLPSVASELSTPFITVYQTDHISSGNSYFLPLHEPGSVFHPPSFC